MNGPSPAQEIGLEGRSSFGRRTAVRRAGARLRLGLVRGFTERAACLGGVGLSLRNRPFLSRR